MTATRPLTAALCLILPTTTAFHTSPPHLTPPNKCHDHQRRHLLQSTAASLLLLRPPPCLASEAVEEVVTMKPFVDKLFTIQVPSRFFAIRRSAKGDLPDVKTGKGRRGGTIFTAGDMGKAEVIAVERFPTRSLLEDEGYTASGDLSTFSSIGEPTAIATLLLRRREKDKPGTQNSAALDADSVQLSPDGRTLTFTLRQRINVEKPELLLETMGVSELYRTTLAKATLTSGDGQLMAVFASALEQDFQGADGVALKKAVDSFVALEQTREGM